MENTVTRTEPLTGAELSLRLELIELAPQDLARMMKRFGDHRSKEALTKSIRRMINGETSVSGEMAVILELLDKLREVGTSFSPELVWHKVSDDVYVARHMDWKATVEKVRRVWRPTIVNPSNHVYPWGMYSHLTTLDSAKRTAEIRLFSAMIGLDEP